MRTALFVSGFLTCLVIVACVGFLSDGSDAEAKASPVKALEDREVYYPGTEDLAPDEMRVVACGTGSAERISAMKIPYNYLDKVFLGHLHSDHFGDLDALWVGGVVANRVTPLRVWGPSSLEEKYGTKKSLEHMEAMLAWDVDTRMGNTDTRGLFLEVAEFDYSAVNEVIYQENGVTIRTIPAIHIYDGPVSFLLEWNGLKFAYSSDTFPNKWWMEHAKGSDIAIHECSIAPESLVEKQNFTPEAALNVGTQIHTSPAQFGKVMAETKPRLAVGYHFFNDFDTMPAVLRDIRKTYDGELALAGLFAGGATGGLLGVAAEDSVSDPALDDLAASLGDGTSALVRTAIADEVAERIRKSATS